MNNNTYYLGIDVGSITTDIVVIDENNRIVFSHIALTSSDGNRATRECLMAMEENVSMTPSDIASSVACGYGRENVSFAHNTVTEITCHATGAHTLFPEVSTIIDIGGEDTKVIGLDMKGRVSDFMMNNKCAAGTGRFLEAIAERLGCSLEEFILAGMDNATALDINNTCTVFAESEVVSLLASGYTLADISRAVHRAIADRIISFSERIRKGNELVLTGGVAKNSLIVKIMREELGCTVFIPEEPQLVGAFGAAIIAKRL